MTPTTQEMLDELKYAREQHAFHSDAARISLNNFIASDDVYTYNVGKQQEFGETVARLESEIKTQQLEEFLKTGNKHPFPKIDIKVKKVFQIVDPAKVLAWVKTSLADALIYDEKKVKEYATKIGPVDGTKIGEVPQVQIASEL